MIRKLGRIASVTATLLMTSAAPELWEAHGKAPAAGAKPNIVLILTDDQRWDTAEMMIDGQESMPNLREELISQGVSFKNAFVSTPLCCPDRASLLAGGFYAHNTGVLTNELPNGGFEKFQDHNSIAVALRQAGYETALVGKYMNRYTLTDGYVPPGWSHFAGVHRMRSWFDFDVVDGEGLPDESTSGAVVTARQYLTRHLSDRAVEFIDDSGDAPFFLYFAPVAPHEPATPAPGDENLFASFSYRGRGAGETDLTDKPGYVRALASSYDRTAINTFAREQLRSLQSVDRSIAEIVEAVRRKGALDNTVFIFTSDNGYLWGEHRLSGKAFPYEESIRVPLVIRMPGAEPHAEELPVVTNVDIGATIVDLAGLDRASDGRSLLPLLSGTATSWRTEFLIQGYGDLRWSGVRGTHAGRTWKYVEYVSGERELYDLTADPFERRSRHKDTSRAVREAMSVFAVKTAALRGLSILDTLLPEAAAGVPYSYTLSRWGGRAPFQWTILEGALPAGITLHVETGLISGTPESATVDARFRIVLRDSSISPYTGMPQAYERWLTLPVADPSRSAQPTAASLVVMSSDQL